MDVEIKERSKKVKIVFEKRTHEENNPFSRTAQMPTPLRGCNTKKIKKRHSHSNRDSIIWASQSQGFVLNVLKFNSYFRFGNVLLFNFSHSDCWVVLVRP